jgi:hypothetical protein
MNKKKITENELNKTSKLIPTNYKSSFFFFSFLLLLLRANNTRQNKRARIQVAAENKYCHCR